MGSFSCRAARLGRGSASGLGSPSPAPHRKGGGGAVRRSQRRNGGREEADCRSEHRRAGAGLRGQRWPRRPLVLHRWSLGRGSAGSTAPRVRDARRQRRRKHCDGVEERGRAGWSLAGPGTTSGHDSRWGAEIRRSIGGARGGLVSVHWEMGAGKGWRRDKWMTGGSSVEQKLEMRD
jgi:hypothetical protein